MLKKINSQHLFLLIGLAYLQKNIESIENHTDWQVEKKILWVWIFAISYIMFHSIEKCAMEIAIEMSMTKFKMTVVNLATLNSFSEYFIKRECLLRQHIENVERE